MKVLHLETGRHLYGGALQVVFLLRELARQAGEEHVLVCPTGAAIAGVVRAAGARVIEMPLGGDLDLAMTGRLRRLLRVEQADVLHIHSRRGADLWGGLAAHLERVPAVLSRRVDNPEPRALVALKYRLYTRVVTISQSIREVLLAEGVPAHKLVCVPSAVDTAVYRPGGDKTWLAAEFGLPADRLTLGMVAQFIERKGHRVLLDALPPVFERQPRLRVLLFGKGPLLDPIRAEIARRGWGERVKLPGFRDDMARIIPALDLLVHPAFMEGLGVALLQAAACGLPIVAGRAGGIPEIVRHGENGLLVEPGDVAGLAAALNVLLADADLRQRYGSVGRAIVERDFSIPAMVAGNRQVYASLLSSRR